ncbi:hypothetical protein [Ferrimonas lipolytica]|uniref:Nucleotide-diphospho-sugar transferase domain-containing protein n=1 Tax=Ferrimonas lipolytica TaxID=2724191 RepID=A0A6H1UBD4_9GAMM|nr:hypothetical protein [Ferrimonas lipolytica]QIZ76354.1 hypothetical protein HER31_05470 [Ferrimonas lipolytica]
MTGTATSNNVLVFSIAVNGYQQLYRRNLASHQQYADGHGYHYQCVQQPRLSHLGKEAVWLKVALMIKALQRGYRWVMYVDADAYIGADTPDLCQLQRPDKYLYVAKGFSGRLNSGVLIVNNSRCVIDYFQQALRHAHMPLPPADDVGWGENGHLIYFAHQQPFVCFIDKRWNNNTSADLDDYIRHYSRGPLYHLHRANLTDRLRFRLYHYGCFLVKVWTRIAHRLARTKPQSLQVEIDQLVTRVERHYDCFSHPSRPTNQSTYSAAPSSKSRLWEQQ